MLLDVSLANKKTLIDISEPAMWHEYWWEDCLLQQLLLSRPLQQQCIGGVKRLHWSLIKFRANCLLHLGINVITFRTSFHLGQSLYLGLQHLSLSFWVYFRCLGRSSTDQSLFCILRHPSTLLFFNFSCPVHQIVTIYCVHISMETQLS